MGKPSGKRQSGQDENPAVHRVLVMIGAESLARYSAEGLGCFAAAALILYRLSTEEGADPAPLLTVPAHHQVKVSRLDLCCDHWKNRPRGEITNACESPLWQARDLSRFVTRAKTRGQVLESGSSPDAWQASDEGWAWVGPRGSTYYLGRRGSAARFLRIYHKLLEAQASGKIAWLAPLWRSLGWDGVASVWRCEIEHGGEWLRAHGLGTLDQARTAEADLWRHYFATVRHIRPTKRRLDHCPTSTIWRVLAVARRHRSSGTWRWQPRPPSGPASEDRLAAQAAGCVASLARNAVPSLQAAGQDGAGWDAGRAPHAVSEDAQAAILDAVCARARRRLEDEIRRGRLFFAFS